MFYQNAFETINRPERKLRTYALFKTKVRCEQYLSKIKNTAIRIPLTKFRLSNHVLNIEKGRHTIPITPKESRFCPFCPDAIEDEINILLNCLSYEHTRKKSI